MKNIFPKYDMLFKTVRKHTSVSQNDVLVIQLEQNLPATSSFEYDVIPMRNVKVGKPGFLVLLLLQILKSTKEISVQLNAVAA